MQAIIHKKKLTNKKNSDTMLANTEIFTKQVIKMNIKQIPRNPAECKDAEMVERHYRWYLAKTIRNFGEKMCAEEKAIFENLMETQYPDNHTVCVDAMQIRRQFTRWYPVYDYAAAYKKLWHASWFRRTFCTYWEPTAPTAAFRKLWDRSIYRRIFGNKDAFLTEFESGEQAPDHYTYALHVNQKYVHRRLQADMTKTMEFMLDNIHNIVGGTEDQ